MATSISGTIAAQSVVSADLMDPCFGIITIDELKTNYLFGLDLTDDNGTEYPDSLYEWYIKAAVDWVQTKLDLPLCPKYIEDEQHDYTPMDYRNYIQLTLKEYPVIGIDQVQMVLPGDTVVQTFDEDWYYLRKDEGQLHIVPGNGSTGTILFGTGGAYLPFVWANNRFVPDVFRINYTAGFPTGQVPDSIKDLVGKVASYGPLNIAGDLLGGAGIASQNISIDGLSQGFNTTSSATNSGYGARLLQYSKEIKLAIPMLRGYYKRISMVVA